LGSLPIAVIVLHARSDRFADLQPLVPRVAAALSRLAPNSVTHVGL
jgi:hypothetical protein